MSSYLYPVKSRPGTNFTEALAQNAASAMNELFGAPPINSRQFLIRAISVTAQENIGPQLNFFSSAAGNTTDPASNTFLSQWGFDASMGAQIGGTGLWQYYVDGLAIPYHDDDTINTPTPPSVHCIMENLAATAKSEGTDGAVEVTLWLEAQSTGAN